ncbi:MAG: Uma2 family endonuclease [Acidobacteria bacterium]|nr:Uma2 family endonuclease [Acidobacteriota bacterium]
MIAANCPPVAELIRDCGKRAEYVGGEVWEKPIPNDLHADCLVILGAALLAYGRTHNGGRPHSEWHHRFGPEGDVRVYLPDMAFLVGPKEIGECAEVPSEIMIEILYPEMRFNDLLDREHFYLRHGARSVWIVDPEGRSVDVCKPDWSVCRFRGVDVLADPLLPGFGLPLTELFG